MTLSLTTNANATSYRFFELFINQKTAYVDGSPYQLDQAPIVINSRTMVPLRFIADKIGAQNIQYEFSPQERVTFYLPDSTSLIDENNQLKQENEKQKTEIEQLKARISELEKQLNPDPPPEPPKDESFLSLNMLDVGQGDALLLRTKNKTILVDAGDVSGNCAGQLKKLGVESLDVIIMTHPHADHIGGMEEVIRTFSCQKVIYNGLDYSSTTWKNLDNLIDGYGIPEEIARKGYTFKIDGVDFDVLAPSSAKISDLNNSSIVLKVKVGETDILLMGDAEESEENEILNSYPELDCDILKVGHHGSNSSSSYQFLHTVTPESALISCGANNSYEHPHEETLHKLISMNSTIYRTDIHGNIFVHSDGYRYSITSHKESEEPTPNEPPPENKKPSMPGNLTSSQIDRHVQLNWQFSTPGTHSIAGYKIYRKNNQSIDEVIIGTVSAYENTFADKNVIPGMIYTYYVTAYDSSTPINESDRSNTSTIQVQDKDGAEEVYVYITNTGSKYHRDGCRYLSKSKIKITLTEAKQRGYEPCSVCNPPLMKIVKREKGFNLQIVYSGGLQTLQGI